MIEKVFIDSLREMPVCELRQTMDNIAKVYGKETQRVILTKVFQNERRKDNV